MTQLIMDGMVLPESQKGGYKCYKTVLGEEITMISGRIVKEVRGSAWIVEYQYGWFSADDRARLLEICEKGRNQPINCSFLPQDSDESLTTSSFFVTELVRPKFMWSRNGTPLWGDFSVKLREVSPHD